MVALMDDVAMVLAADPVATRHIASSELNIIFVNGETAKKHNNMAHIYL